MMLQTAGLALVTLVGLDIWAAVSVIGSGASIPTKILWIALIAIFPLLGFLLWLIAGPADLPDDH